MRLRLLEQYIKSYILLKAIYFLKNNLKLFLFLQKMLSLDNLNFTKLECKISRKCA